MNSEKGDGLKRPDLEYPVRFDDQFGYIVTADGVSIASLVYNNDSPPESEIDNIGQFIAQAINAHAESSPCIAGEGCERCKHLSDYAIAEADG